MSVNVVGEDFGLHQLAGNVSPEVVAQIQQLAAQAAEYARLAKESSDAAQELAGSAKQQSAAALERADDTILTKKGSFSANQEGWYTLFKVSRGGSYTLTAMKEATTNSSGDIQMGIDMTQTGIVPGFYQIRQHGLGFISSVRTFFEDGYYIIEAYLSAYADTYHFSLSCDVLPGKITAEFVGELSTQNPASPYRWDIKWDAGSIADRAKYDIEGNDIAEAVGKANNSVQTLRYSGQFPPNTWVTLLKMHRPYYTHFNLRIFHIYQGESNVLAEVLISTINTGATAHRAHISQISQLNGLQYFDAVRVTRSTEKDEIYIEVHNVSNTQTFFSFDITGMIKEPSGLEAPFTASTSNDGDVIALLSLTANIGIVADRALADGAGNNIVNTYMKKGEVYGIVNPTKAEFENLPYGAWAIFTKAPGYVLVGDAITPSKNIYTEVPLTLRFDFNMVISNNSNITYPSQSDCYANNLTFIGSGSHTFNGLFGSLKTVPTAANTVLMFQRLCGSYVATRQNCTIIVSSFGAINYANTTSVSIFKVSTANVKFSVQSPDGIHQITDVYESASAISEQSDEPQPVSREDVPSFIIDMINAYEAAEQESEENE